MRYSVRRLGLAYQFSLITPTPQIQSRCLGNLAGSLRRYSGASSFRDRFSKSSILFRSAGTLLSHQNRPGVHHRHVASQAPRSSPSQDDGNADQSSTAATKLLKSLRPHENIYTIPNILTFSRLLAAPAVGYFILTGQPKLALALFAYAGVTDAVDGYLARRFNSATVVGTVIDPMADKALMTISVVALAIQGGIPIWLATIILGRDVALAISAIYFRWISLPPPKTMARYWDFSLPSAEVHPTEISKINTLLQLLFIGSAVTLPVLPETLVAAWNLEGVFEGFQYLVAGTTFWSGASYIYSKDAVKILTEEEIEKRTREKDEQSSDLSKE